MGLVLILSRIVSAIAVWGLVSLDDGERGHGWTQGTSKEFVLYTSMNNEYPWGRLRGDVNRLIGQVDVWERCILLVVKQSRLKVTVAHIFEPRSSSSSSLVLDTERSMVVCRSLGCGSRQNEKYGPPNWCFVVASTAIFRGRHPFSVRCTLKGLCSQRGSFRNPFSGCGCCPHDSELCTPASFFAKTYRIVTSFRCANPLYKCTYRRLPSISFGRMRS